MKLQNLINDAAALESKVVETQKPEEEPDVVEDVQEIDDAEVGNNDEPSTDTEEPSADDESADQPDSEPDTDDTDSDEHEDDLAGLDPNRHKSWKYLREKNKKLKEELKAFKEEQQKVKEQLARLEGFQEATTRQQPEQRIVESDPEPNKELYPEDHNAWKIRKLEQQQEDLRAQIKRREGEQVWSRIDQQTAEKDALYKQAKGFLLEQVKTEIKKRSPSISESDLLAQSKNVELTFVGQMAQAGLDPVAAIKAEAFKYGFTPSAQKPINKPKLNQPKIKENIVKSGSLVGKSGSAKEKMPSAEKLASMSFAKLKNNNDASTELDRQIKELAQRRFSNNTDPYA